MSHDEAAAGSEGRSEARPQQPVAAHVAAMVRKYRKQQGISQQTVGASTGMGRGAIVYLETGLREAVTVDEVYALAEVLNVVPASLMPDLGGRPTFEQSIQLIRDRYSEALKAKRNPELAKAILTGIEEAHRGDTVDLGSFAQYADDEDED